MIVLFRAAITHSLLELVKISWAEGVGLGNDGDEIDTGAKALHDLNVEWLQSVTGGTDKVQARMDAEVDLFRSARLLLLKHVRLVLVIQEFNDRLPRVAVVHIVAETRGIDDRETNYTWLVNVGTLTFAIAIWYL